MCKPVNNVSIPKSFDLLVFVLANFTYDLSIKLHKMYQYFHLCFCNILFICEESVISFSATVIIGFQYFRFLSILVEHKQKKSATVAQHYENVIMQINRFQNHFFLYLSDNMELTSCKL